MANDYSRAALLKFLDYLADKGLGNKHTIVARKAASNKMLSILDDAEASDLRTVDVSEIASRFNNLKGSGYTPKSLQVYRSRFGKALTDFFRYKENPANFKMNGSASARDSSASQAGKPSSAASNAKSEPSPQRKAEGTSSVQTLDIPIALRPTCIIQLNGIPIDMTSSEARKIANVVIAMASEKSE